MRAFFFASLGMIAVALGSCAPSSSIPAGRDPAVRRQMPAGFAPILEQADSFELVALDDPQAFPARLTDYPHAGVRAQFTVDDAHDRLRIVGALYESIRDGGMIALCFHPHHAIRARRGGAALTIVVCLSCLQAEVRDAAGGTRTVAIFSPTIADALGPAFARHGLRFDRSFFPFGRWLAAP
jgi:hypothetical protein